MLVHGIRGSQLPSEDPEPLSLEELEVFGVDWDALRQEQSPLFRAMYQSKERVMVHHGLAKLDLQRN